MHRHSAKPGSFKEEPQMGGGPQLGGGLDFFFAHADRILKLPKGLYLHIGRVRHKKGHDAGTWGYMGVYIVTTDNHMEKQMGNGTQRVGFSRVFLSARVPHP